MSELEERFRQKLLETELSTPEIHWAMKAFRSVLGEPTKVHTEIDSKGAIGYRCRRDGELTSSTHTAYIVAIQPIKKECDHIIRIKTPTENWNWRFCPLCGKEV